MSKRIEIVVDSKGASTVQTKGYVGSECVEASRFIEDALGKKAGEQTTAEFYMQSSGRVQQNQRSG